MWPFNKKTKPNTLIPTRQTWKVPADHQLEFCKLYDDMMLKNSKTNIFLFWKFVTEITPATYDQWGARVYFENHKPNIIYIKNL